MATEHYVFLIVNKHTNQLVVEAAYEDQSNAMRSLRYYLDSATFDKENLEVRKIRLYG